MAGDDRSKQKPAVPGSETRTRRLTADEFDHMLDSARARMASEERPNHDPAVEPRYTEQLMNFTFQF